MKVGASSAEQYQERVDVLIIGSGWAGMGAARYLQSRKINNFKIIEARDYIGGRSRTITLNDGVSQAELGSGWIHGAKEKNPMFQIVEESGINANIIRNLNKNDDDDSVVEEDPEMDDNSDPLDALCPVDAIWLREEDKLEYESSKLLSESEVNKLMTDLFHGKNGFLKYQSLRQNFGRENSIRSVLNDYVQQKKLSPRENAILEWILDTQLAQEYSGSLEDLSLLQWNSDGEIDGNDLHLANDCIGGHEALIKHYSSSFREKVHLNCKVTSIDYRTNKVAVKYVSPSIANSRCKATAIVEKEIIAKKVIVTVPVGVLQAGTINFVPCLPIRKMKAIRRIGVGLLNSCVMLWDDCDHLPWKDENKWIKTILCAEGRKQGWFTEFYSPKSRNGKKIVYAYTSGRIAKVVETMSNEEIQNEALNTLRSLYEGIPYPKQVVVSRWGSDEFSMGAYTFNKVGQSAKDRTVLAKPVKRRLYFAGEGTSSQFFGTTHGALISGVVAAKSATSYFNIM